VPPEATLVVKAAVVLAVSLIQSPAARSLAMSFGMSVRRSLVKQHGAAR
jgi:hypothetical protein